MWRKFKLNLGYVILHIDDWFADKGVFFDWFVKDKDNYVSFLCRWGFDIVNRNYNE